MDKYFQITKCFRDEDLRADRQPEFTQLDIEMSFIKEEDLFSIIENLIKIAFKELLNEDIKIPFVKITHDQALKNYGSDKPHLDKKE